MPLDFLVAILKIAGGNAKKLEVREGANLTLGSVNIRGIPG